jgi:predicted O-methyltransferase YrrM
VIASIIRRAVPERFRPIGYLTHLVRERTNCQVRQGPFAAMHYVRDSIGSAYLPKLLGIYERELSQYIEAICAQRPSLIVDLGAGEGYYAVGLASRIPSARLIAFEMDSIGQAVVAQMAALNRVSERVEIRGKCEPLDLAEALGDEPRPVVVCDVEGYEDKLLDPVVVHALCRATILVEVHEFVIRGITDEIHRRFAETHKIEHIWQESRSRSDFPWRTLGTSLLPGSYLDWAVSEWRPERMSWLWMVPKN